MTIYIYIYNKWQKTTAYIPKLHKYKKKRQTARKSLKKTKSHNKNNKTY